LKKPNYYKGAFGWLVIVFVSFLAGPLIGQWLQNKTGVSLGFAALVGYIPLILFGCIAVCSLQNASAKSAEWVRSYGLKQANEVTLKSVDGRKPTEEDLINPDPDAKYSFMVVHGGTFLPVTYTPKDPEFNDLMAKIAGSKLARNAHIQRTQIIAVNNKTLTDTHQRISITKAIIGGLIAGEAGFILGRASGESRSITRQGENQYTFIVYYDDAPPETEKVYESNKRFKYLVSKLKDDE